MPEFWYNACKCSLSYSGGLGWFVYDNPALTLLLPVLFFPLSPCLHSSPPHPPLQLLPHLPTVFLFLCLPTLSPHPSYPPPFYSFSLLWQCNHLFIPANLGQPQSQDCGWVEEWSWDRGYPCLPQEGWSNTTPPCSMPAAPLLQIMTFPTFSADTMQGMVS